MHEFENVVTFILIIIIAIAHLREIIAKLFHIPKNRKWSWIFYGEDEKTIVTQVLKELNIIPEDVRTSLSLGKASLSNKKIDLIVFISKYLIKFDTPIRYGKTTPSESFFYIDTMSASLDQTSLKFMDEIMFRLIATAGCNPDFIITPNSCNTTFGKWMSDHYGYISIFAKGNKEGSFVHIPVGVPLGKLNKDDLEKLLRTNFYGSEALINCAGSQSSKLKGIILDCNTSGGSQILEVMNSFNEIIDNKSVGEFCNIEKITKAFVLFRPDTDDSDIDSKFSRKGYSLYRWMDLTEDIKKRIYNLKQKFKVEQLDINKVKQKQDIGDLLLFMEYNNLIKHNN